MKFVKFTKDLDQTHIRYMFYCPGCKIPHSIIVGPGRWDISELHHNLTISPSIRTYYPAHEGIPEETTCHLFIREGKIEFLNDCKHDLAGQIVDMVEFPDTFDLGEWI